MEQRVKEIIESAWSGAQVSTERLSGGPVSGSVVWDGFEGQDDVDRQTMLRKLLSAELAHDIADIGILLTYAPRIIEIMAAA